MRRTRVKICCISSAAEAKLAIDEGADALGLVSQMPSGPGVIDEGLINAIATHVSPGVDTFLLTAHHTAHDIATQVHACGTTTVQIVKHIDPAEYPELIRRAPAVRRVQVIHVEDRRALDLINAYSPHVHALLLDSGRPGARVATFGGTGQTHDWDISAECVNRSPKPVFLAGGLNPVNIEEAISRVRPYGVDLCSGVRSNGELNQSLLSAFMSGVLQGS